LQDDISALHIWDDDGDTVVMDAMNARSGIEGR